MCYDPFNKTNTMAFTHSLVLLAVPCIQFLSLRYWLHSILGLRIGYVGMTDYDFVPPSLIAFFVLLHCLEEEQPLQLRFNKIGAAVNFLLVSLFIVWSSFLGESLEIKSGAPFLVWLGLAFATISSGLFFWVRPAYFIFHPLRFLMGPAFLIATSKISTRYLFDTWWHPMANLTAKSAYHVLSIFTSVVELKSDQVAGGQVWQVLAHPLYQVSIGFGCCGLEGIFFFLAVATMILMARWKDFGLGRGALFVGLGIVGMYWTNVFRIVVVDLIGMGLVLSVGAETAAQWVDLFFHVAVGWVIYAGFLCSYFVAWSLMLRQEDGPIILGTLPEKA
jgi:exosortase/archaeosortase family protein